MGIKSKITKIHYDKNAKGQFFEFLKFCSMFYAAASAFKNKLYDCGILTPKKARGAFVVSVGNLTTGGVGKTPVVAKIAKYYLDNGEKVAIISRGYGAKGLSGKNINLISDGEKTFYAAEVAGDEPVWLAENVRGAYVITCHNRYKAAKYAIEKFGVTKIVLDDGFQHRKLHRDLDIVLVGSEMGFGNENLLPAGPLREGLEAFKRIDKLVVVSKNIDHTRAEKYAKVMGKKLKKETFVCYTEPDYAYNILNVNERLEKESSIVAFSAIGQPQQFYKFLKDYDIIETVDFDDHHNYTQNDIDELCLMDVDNLVTTEKDACKLTNLYFRDAKVFALKLKTNLDVESLLK